MKIFTLIIFGLILNLSVGQASSPEHQEKAESAHKAEIFPQPKANAELTTRPGMVELLEPKALAKISGNQVTLKWKEAAHAETYRIQVATDPNFKWLVLSQDFYKGTSFELTGLEAGKLYFWRVYGQKSSNDRGWTSSFAHFSSFQIQ